MPYTDTREPHAYDLGRFGLHDMLRCGIGLRHAAKDTT
jgi:hypothetical protein